jgi:hypothetical protein
MSAFARGTGYGQVNIQLSVSVAAHLGVRDGDRMAIDRGTLGDDGWVRLRRSDEGMIVRQHGHEGSIQFRMNGRWFGVVNQHDSVRVQYSLKVGRSTRQRMLLVLLPRWARGGDDD